MKSLLPWAIVEDFIAKHNFVLTIGSYVAVLLIFVNQLLFNSFALGFAASFLFFFINAFFMGHALFPGESAFVRFVLGGLFQLVLFGVVGWMVLIAYNLDAVMSTIVLGILAGLSSLLNRLRRKREGDGR